MWLSLLAAGCAGAYVASMLLPIRGLHDLLVPGARFRGPSTAVFLTFDDGPHPERTPMVLDRLAEASATATFFVIGERARRYPSLVRRIAGAGHTLGNHSFAHRWLVARSSRTIARELADTQAAIADIVGQPPRLVRPPYGSRDFRFYRQARDLGLVPVMWSVDSRDWAGAGADTIARHCRRAAPGDIVLLHDGSARAVHTVAALSGLVVEGRRYAGLPAW